MECDPESCPKNDQTTSEAASQKILMDGYFQSQAIQSQSVKTGTSNTEDQQSTLMSKSFKIPRKQSQQKETMEIDNVDADVPGEKDENLHQLDKKSPNIVLKEETDGPASAPKKKIYKEPEDNSPSPKITPKTEKLNDSDSCISQETPNPSAHTNDDPQTNEVRKRKKPRALKIRPLPYEVCITDESKPDGTIFSKNAKILRKIFAEGMKKLILTPKVHIPQFLGTSLENGKLVVTCADFAAMDFINKTIKNMPLPWRDAELKAECRMRREAIVSVTASEKFTHISELLAECKQNVKLFPEKWRLIAYEDSAGTNKYTLAIDMNSFLVLQEEKGVVRCGKTDFVFNLNFEL